MISFYPGPSKVHPRTATFIQSAVKEGILSVNHRSKEFTDLSQKTILLLKKKLNIPAGYSVFFTSSATECWEIIAQSLTEKKSSHIYNGAFGEKWFEYAKKIVSSAESFAFSSENELNVSQLTLSSDSEIICLVQNETSNGTQVSNRSIEGIREKYPDKLIAVDATSSMAGVKLDFKNADIWLASVQKCLALPAGMGLLICSPAAIARAEKINERNHYNSLALMMEKMKDWQTSYTPNVLGIYLLYQVLKNSRDIGTTDKLIRKRYKEWYDFLKNFKEVRPLIQNKDCRSYTVITLQSEEATIKKIKDKAKKEGLILGNGYGKWSKTTFRIANFPALTEKEIAQLKKFLKNTIK